MALFWRHPFFDGLEFDALPYQPVGTPLSRAIRKVRRLAIVLPSCSRSFLSRRLCFLLSLVRPVIRWAVEGNLCDCI